MSTRPELTRDDDATTTRTATPTDFSTETTGAPPATGDAPSPLDGPSWTDRCKRQFATDDAGRMRNLADDRNQAMHDGV
ncbi:hypothetical protein G9C85_05835 [Halorubellus sp. JP-L1]|uniref:hypothetical protein n=1 Tax=Halorubellus sp. JP-L1 TaxID=2715753 RepID=UPI001409537A|nr:hypothetical protein [Halorubellus sp. JP-L1]NHN41156.1 hypothetical protein [Halorubellus sp. JP-L1]